MKTLKVEKRLSIEDCKFLVRHFADSIPALLLPAIQELIRRAEEAQKEAA